MQRILFRVVSLHPGRIDTDLQVEMQAQAGRLYRPEEHMRASDVAAAVRLSMRCARSAAEALGNYRDNEKYEQ